MTFAPPMQGHRLTDATLLAVAIPLNPNHLWCPMSVERRVKRVALSVAILLVPAALVFAMREGLVTKFLKAPAQAEEEHLPLVPETTSRLAPDQSAWHRVVVDKPVAPVAAPAAAAPASATVAAVPTPKDAIQIRQPTQPVPIGKAAR